MRERVRSGACTMQSSAGALRPLTPATFQAIETVILVQVPVVRGHLAAQAEALGGLLRVGSPPG